MKSNDNVLAKFKHDVRDHVMTIVHETEENRHVVFKNPKSSQYWFELITWSGCLCISGDMGTYVFRRIEDMFYFFPMANNDFNKRRDGELSINPGYWAEKLQAQDRAGHTRFSPKLLEEYVNEQITQYLQDNPLKKKIKTKLVREIHDEVLGYSEDQEHEVYDALFNFESEVDPNFPGFDPTEWCLREYTDQYIWICYAIVWGIQMYQQHNRDCYGN